MPTSSERRLAIEVTNLRKDYRLGEFPDVRHLASRLLRRRRDDGQGQDGGLLLALSGVSFSLEVGECLGIMGTNGSGKSTLVEILSGITIPTAGLVRVRGRVLPLLEVGAVFQGELTGRENVMLFGTVLGLKGREINEAMPEIAAFGGIDEWHMDTPLKRHSTGMRARLSFAVAMRFPADIYVFDEVIAVVDDQFRAVAVQEIRSLVDAGRTVVFISHDLGLVRELCTKGLWLEHGYVRAFGPVEDVADRYANSQAAGLEARAEGVRT